MHPRLTLAIAVLEAIATLAFAISGFVEARKNRLDSVGTFVVALATAFGGGTMRDVLLERRPFYWVEHQAYVIAIFGLSLVAPLVLRMASRLSAERLLLAADAIGLGIFSISGTSIALDAQMPRFVAAMMGVTTGVFGGVIRDVLCNDIPLILRDSRPYATCVRRVLGLSAARVAAVRFRLQRARGDGLHPRRAARHLPARYPAAALAARRAPCVA